MEVKVPSLPTVTALFNIYLLLSICMVTVYGTNKPLSYKLSEENSGSEDDFSDSDAVQRTRRSDTQPAQSSVSVNNVKEISPVSDTSRTVIIKDKNKESNVFASRSLDTYYDYEPEEDDSFFRPSVKIESKSDGIRVRDRYNGLRPRHRQRRPSKRKRLLGERRQSYAEYRPYRNRQRQRTKEQSYNQYPDESVYQRQSLESYLRPSQSYLSDYRQQFQSDSTPARTDIDSGRFPQGRPPPLSYPGDYQEEDELQSTPTQRPPSFLDTLFKLIRPPKGEKVKIRPDQAEPSEPSYEFVYNEVDSSEDKTSPFSIYGNNDLFIPNSGDYDDYNLNYLDEEEEAPAENLPEYDFKDVLHSIKNNESRIITLKKFLSAASGMTDRAGTDPAFMLWSMPLTILSILGVFYAVAAVGVLGYKYILLTTGNTNGQAVAILPVLFIFSIPVVMATVFMVARGSLDGQINIGQLARGDLNRVFRQDFDSLDFAYDLGVGATAILGLGWIVSVTL